MGSLSHVYKSQNSSSNFARQYKRIYVFKNESYATIINIATGVQAEQSRNFGKMIILI